MPAYWFRSVLLNSITNINICWVEQSRARQSRAEQMWLTVCSNVTLQILSCLIDKNNDKTKQEKKNTQNNKKWGKTQKKILK